MISNLNQWSVRAAIVLLLGLLLNVFLFKPGNKLDEQLTDFTGYMSYRTAKVMRLDVEIDENVSGLSNIGGCKVFCGTSSWVYIGDDCNARNLFLLYVGFLISVPVVTFSRRLKFLLGGLLLIFFANVLRIVLLLEFAAEIPQILNLMHKYVFQILMYVLLFVLWNAFLKNLETVDNESKS